MQGVVDSQTNLLSIIDTRQAEGAKIINMAFATTNEAIAA